MAWALITDGVDDRCSITKVTIPSGEDFTIRFIWKFTAEISGFQLGESGAFNNGVSLWYRSQSVWNAPNKIFSKLYLSGTSAELEHISAPIIDTQYDWEIQRISGEINIVDTATQASLVTATVLNNGALAFDSLFKWGNTSNPFTGETQLIQLTSNSNNHTWDATASDHSNTGSQPILIDTVGSNNATGVNFPTDGSAWVDLGGGGITGTVAFTGANGEVLATGDANQGFVASAALVGQPTVAVIEALLGNAISGTVGTLLADGLLAALGDTGGVVGSVASVLADGVIDALGQMGQPITGTVAVTLRDDILSALGNIPSDTTGEELGAVVQNAVMDVISNVVRDL